MNEPTTTTYSLEVLAFPGALDEAELPATFAEVFGISKDEAARIVSSVPVAVKQGADAETTKRLAKTLLALGAELCIRNEQTGEERIQRAPSSGPSGATPSTPSDEAPESPSKAEAPADSSPRPNPEANPEADAEPDSSISADKIGKSVPPPSRMAPLDTCASCSRRIDKGTRCQSCGWSNKDSKRYCKQCQRVLKITSSAQQKRKSLAILGVFWLIGAAAAGFFFGVFAALVVVALLGVAVFAIDATTMSFRCTPCHREIEARTLRPVEKKQLSALRRRAGLVSVLSFLVGVGLAVPVVAGARELQLDSFGYGWRVKVPFTHRDVERRVVMVSTPTGERRVLMRIARNSRFPVETFLLMHTMFAGKVAPPLDDPTVERLMARSIDAAIGGGPELGKLATVSTPNGPAREGKFQATIGGRKVAGRLRGQLFEQNLVMVGFVATGDDATDNAAGLGFLNGLVTVR